MKSLGAKFFFDDIASVRSALLHHEGWSVLPRYCVRAEEEQKTLRVMKAPVRLEPTSFGIWWNRENPPRKEILDGAFSWLKKQRL